MPGSMSIVSSVIQWQLLQTDGTSNVRELHTDNLGVTYIFDYVLDKGGDAKARLILNAASLLVSVPAQEISDNINAVTTLGSLATLTFNYSIVADNVAALRAAYKIATQTQAIFIGDYLGTLTGGQIQAVFSCTAKQMTDLCTNFLTPAASAAATIRAAVGT